MTVTTLTWDKVRVSYKDGRSDLYRNAQVTYDNELKTLRIFQPGSENMQKHLLLSKAELIRMSPWEMKWKANWWSSNAPDVEGEIICEF